MTVNRSASATYDVTAGPVALKRKGQVSEVEASHTSLSGVVVMRVASKTDLSITTDAPTFS